MKKTSNIDIQPGDAATLASADDTPFFAREQPLRLVKTDRLAHVSAGAAHEKRRKTP
ncbi:MAG: hypothetical protein Tsb0020_13020 [Haliangiales bacterium]